MSKKFNRVKNLYDSGAWNKQMVHDAVGRWITAEEYKIIVGEEYVE